MTLRWTPACGGLVLGGLLLLLVPSSWGQSLSYAATLQYTTGEYIFADRTHGAAFVQALDVSGERYRVGLRLPVLYQSTPWVSYTSGGPVPSGGPQNGAVRGGGRGAGVEGQSNHQGQGPGGRRPIVLPDTVSVPEVGVGDPTLSADLTLLTAEPGRPSVQITGSVKAPVADVDRGFGTGAWDAGLGVAVSQPLLPWFLLGDATVWWMGDMDDLPLNEHLSYSVGVGRVFGQGAVGLLATLAGSTVVIDGTDASLQALLGVQLMPSDRWSLSASGGWGLTTTAPDLALSLGASVQF
jgi:hypothetical protein